ncbi:hypothetical protein MGAST_07345, partial [Mycobacterium gastri 'Wayne']
MRNEPPAGLAQYGDAPVIPSPADVPPAARGVVDDLANAAETPVKALVCGGIGTGKTSLLAAGREALRRAGLTVLTRPPRDGDPSDAVFVVDDAHLLTDAELVRLTERASEPHATVVVAAEDHQQDPALRALTTAIERERPRISLGPRPVAEHLRDSTAGLPFLIHAVSDGAHPPAQAAKFALVKRLRRLDEPTLDVMLLMSLSPGLGVTDAAAALGVSTADARRLVDRAYGSGLVIPAHPPAFLQAVHDAIALIIGNARHHQIETSLLRTQFDISPISQDLALQLAEHGLHDERLAAVLSRYAVTDGDSARSARLYRAAVNAGAAGLTDR